jgi:hypothetical protein
VELFGAFPVAESTAKDRFLSFARRAAVALNLVPGTLKGRELLKRLVYGKLEELKGEVRDDMQDLEQLVSLSGERPACEFKVLYAVAHLP